MIIRPSHRCPLSQRPTFKAVRGVQKEVGSNVFNAANVIAQRKKSRPCLVLEFSHDAFHIPHIGAVLLGAIG